MPRPVVPAPTRFHRLALVGSIVAAVLVCQGPQPTGAASRPAVTAEEAMVVSPEPRATAIGVEVLRRGGNAVDAAVAVCFALAVTYPRAGNLGGGGFLLYRENGQTHHGLDFRETAPAALDPASFLDERGRPIPGLSVDGGMAVGVPGSVAGLFEAHRRWGSRPWAALIRPAQRLAREGFVVDAALAEALTLEDTARLAANPDARAIFYKQDRPLREGERLVQRDLAASLARIARRGPEGFYRGPVARAIVAAVVDTGGVVTEQDLAGYRPVMRRPVSGRYRGYRVVSFPPPSSGGVALLQILGMLEGFDVARAGPASSESIHLIAEVCRRVFADRSRWLGDPDHHDNPVERLLSPEYLGSRAADIRLETATPSASVRPGMALPKSRGETLHVSIADAAGHAVALTTTLNLSFGSGIVAPGTGILLNNEMDDFALAPGVPNSFGLLGGEANAVASGKRPLSSMTPTVVEFSGGGPRPALVLGSPGGSAIITSVAQVIVNVIDHGMPLQEAVDAPRFHHQWLPDRIVFEARGLPADVRRNLEARGHELKSEERIGNVNALGVDERGRWIGAADPRRGGLAAGF